MMYKSVALLIAFNNVELSYACMCMLMLCVYVYVWYSSSKSCDSKSIISSSAARSETTHQSWQQISLRSVLYINQSINQSVNQSVKTLLTPPSPCCLAPLILLRHTALYKCI